MKVWYCFKRKRQLVKGEVDCDLAPAHKKCGWMELHPAGTRVVTADSEHCDECGQAYDDVYALPDDLWALIHERAPAGLLCPACALRRVVESSRVVTAEALVIEPGEDDLWPEWAIDLIWEAIGPSFNRGQINRILDALAQSKEGE